MIIISTWQPLVIRDLKANSKEVSILKTENSF